MDTLTTTHNAAVQIIDTSIVRVHQQGACVADNREQHMGRSRGGLTSKIHAVVDANGLPVQLAITTGEAHDNRLCSVLLKGMQPRTMLLADRGYDADWIRTLVRQQGAWACLLATIIPQPTIGAAVARNETITGMQIRAARGFLAWDRRDLAKNSVVTLYTIERLETGAELSGAAMTKGLAAIKATLEAECIEFINEAEVLGVLLHPKKRKARAKGK